MKATTHNSPSFLNPHPLFAYDYLLGFANHPNHSRLHLTHFLIRFALHFQLTLHLHQASPRNLEEIRRILIIDPSTMYINYKNGYKYE